MVNKPSKEKMSGHVREDNPGIAAVRHVSSFDLMGLP